MRMNLKNLLWLLAAVICFASCSKEDIIEKVAEIPEGKILVGTEIVIDGVVQSDTRAVSEAGYTTGDGLYDKKDKVTVAAFANEGYELVTFYDKKDPNINLGASYTLTVQEPRTFKAEFARKYTITVSANPTAGGTVAGGGTYRGGKTCTLTATANAGYVFDGWYEGSTKVSSDTNYSFIVSSNRTIQGKFEDQRYIFVGADRYIISPTKAQQVGTNNWYSITYGNNKYVAVGMYGNVAYSADGINWTTKQIANADNSFSETNYCNGKFIAVGMLGCIASSTDGIYWTVKAVGTTYWNSITYGNGKYIAVGFHMNGLDLYGDIAYSIDGINWTVKTLGSGSWNSITYNNGKYVTVGAYGNIAYSSDGINWTTKTVGSSSWGSITYGNGKYIAMGAYGSIAYSTDGINWTTKTVGSKTWRKLTYSNREFTAIGDGGFITSSIDGNNWTTPEQVKNELGKPLTVDLYGICVMQ